MDGESRTSRIERLIAAEPGARDGGIVGRLTRICAATARAMPASGAGVSLMDGLQQAGTVASTGPVLGLLDETQLTLGEGPGIDAVNSRRPVLEPDLGGRGMRRWPHYSPIAHALGVEAIFCLPLQVGAARLGVLDILRDVPGRVSATALADALAFADAAVTTVLDGQDHAAYRESPAGLDDVMTHRMQIYQAQGMVMVDLDVTLVEAMARLRAYAFASDRQIGEVARDIVAGSLRIDRDVR